MKNSGRWKTALDGKRNDCENSSDGKADPQSSEAESDCVSQRELSMRLRISRSSSKLVIHDVLSFRSYKRQKRPDLEPSHIKKGSNVQKMC